MPWSGRLVVSSRRQLIRKMQPMTDARPGNVPLRTLRVAQGYKSQKDFAAALNAIARENGLGELSITPRTIRRWESPTPPRPQRAHAQALQLLLGTPIAELGLTSRIAPSGDSTTADAGPLPQLVPIRDAIPDEVISDYESLTNTYRTLCRAIPPVSMLASITTHIHLGAALLEVATPAQRPHMARTAAQAWLLAGRIELFDNESADQAGAVLATALDYAHAGADPALAAAILGHIALITASSPDSDTTTSEQIRMARAFSRRAHNPRRLEAWLDAAEAQITLSNNDIQRALTLANNVEAALGNAEPAPEWLDWLTPHPIAGLKASILLAAGRTAEAFSTLAQAEHDLPTSSAKPRVLLLIDMAKIAAFEADPAKAAGLLTKAIKTAQAAGQESVAPRILDARRSLNEWNDSPTVLALDDHLTQWRPTLGSVQ